MSNTSDTLLDLHPGPWALDPVTDLWVTFCGRVGQPATLSPVRGRFWPARWALSRQWGGYTWARTGKVSELEHRIIARAWVPNPDNKPQVHHIDHDSHNNKVENLMWVTQSENNSFIWAAGRGWDLSKRKRTNGGQFA